jgi:hypothetical protein
MNTLAPQPYLVSRLHSFANRRLRLPQHGARDANLACELRQLQIVMLLNAPFLESNVITKWVQANTTSSATVFVHATPAKRYVLQAHMSLDGAKKHPESHLSSRSGNAVNKPLRVPRN